MTSPEEVEAEERRKQEEANWEKYKWEWTSPQHVGNLEKKNSNE